MRTRCWYPRSPRRGSRGSSPSRTPACSPRSACHARPAPEPGAWPRPARGDSRASGWSLPWVSSANTDFNFDFGASFTEEQVREFLAPLEGRLPPIVRQNAAATGTDVLGYLLEAPAMSAFTLQDGAVYQTYATTARGVEPVMGYYPILDRAPKGRDEGDAPQTWIRRRDEYV